MGLYDAAKRIGSKVTPQQATNPAVQDDVWTREYLLNKYGSQYGLKDSDIGFNNGMVTVKGMDAFKPASLTDGRSYANPAMMDDSMNRIAIQGNLGIPEGYVRGRDYINMMGSNYGINDSQIGWKTNPNTNMTDITVGGQVVGNGYINPAEGRTYVNQSQLKDNLSKFAQNNGMRDIRQVEDSSVMKPDSFQSPFQDKINMLVDKILNAPKFDFNVETSPKFQALKGQYEKQGQTAFNNAIGGLSSMTGGRLNSWAASAASQAQNKYNEDLMGLVPGMYNEAYNEYSDGINRDINNLNSLVSLDNNKYGRFRDTVGDNQNMRNYLLSKYTGDRSFLEGQRQFNAGTGQWDKNFDRSGTQWDKTFNREGAQWDKSFNEGVRQFGENNKIAQQNADTSSSNSGLGWADYNFKTNPDGPYYQGLEADTALKLGQANNMMESGDLGHLYSSMMSGKDHDGSPLTPDQWLQKYGTGLPKELLDKLYNYAKGAGAFKEDGTRDLATMIKEFGGK
jgi:hypothetical protein